MKMEVGRDGKHEKRVERGRRRGGEERGIRGMRWKEVVSTREDEVDLAESSFEWSIRNKLPGPVV